MSRLKKLAGADDALLSRILSAPSTSARRPPSPFRPDKRRRVEPERLGVDSDSEDEGAPADVLPADPAGFLSMMLDVLDGSEVALGGVVMDTDVDEVAMDAFARSRWEQLGKWACEQQDELVSTLLYDDVEADVAAESLLTWTLPHTSAAARSTEVAAWAWSVVCWPPSLGASAAASSFLLDAVDRGVRFTAQDAGVSNVAIRACATTSAVAVQTLGQLLQRPAFVATAPAVALEDLLARALRLHANPSAPVAALPSLRRVAAAVVAALLCRSPLAQLRGDGSRLRARSVAGLEARLAPAWMSSESLIAAVRAQQRRDAAQWAAHGAPGAEEQLRRVVRQRCWSVAGLWLSARAAGLQVLSVSEACVRPPAGASHPHPTVAVLELHLLAALRLLRRFVRRNPVEALSCHATVRARALQRSGRSPNASTVRTGLAWFPHPALCCHEYHARRRVGTRPGSGRH